MISRVSLCIGISIAVLFSSVYAEETDKTQPEKKVYTHIDSGGVVLASSGKYYLEEFDSFTRPISATVWDNKLIVKEITWLYEGDSQQATKKIETEKIFSQEENFDAKGRLVSLKVRDTSGLVTEKTEWNRDLEDRLVSYTFTQNDVTQRTEWLYSEGDTILEKLIFLRDNLVSRSVYSDNDNWIETIFHKTIPVLTVQWVDGVRVDEIKKQ